MWQCPPQRTCHDPPGSACPGNSSGPLLGEDWYWSRHTDLPPLPCPHQDAAVAVAGLQHMWGLGWVWPQAERAPDMVVPHPSLQLAEREREQEGQTSAPPADQCPGLQERGLVTICTPYLVN